jgi:hypothetical protein|tara:strand:+ start:280 stop:459 length:180 start_codon:yes stop_codon:yes gene_type:complete
MMLPIRIATPREKGVCSPYRAFALKGVSLFPLFVLRRVTPKREDGDVERGLFFDGAKPF